MQRKWISEGVPVDTCEFPASRTFLKKVSWDGSPEAAFRSAGDSINCSWSGRELYKRLKRLQQCHRAAVDGWSLQRTVSCPEVVEAPQGSPQVRFYLGESGTSMTEEEQYRTYLYYLLNTTRSASSEFRFLRTFQEDNLKIADMTPSTISRCSSITRTTVTEYVPRNCHGRRTSEDLVNEVEDASSKVPYEDSFIWERSTDSSSVDGGKPATVVLDPNQLRAYLNHCYEGTPRNSLFFGDDFNTAVCTAQKDETNKWATLNCAIRDTLSYVLCCGPCRETS